MEKEKNTNTETVETQEQVDTPTEKTVTVEEMQRRINKEKEKQDEISKELADYKAKESERIQEALEKFKKEQDMNADELAEYKRQEAEKKHQEELDKLKAQIDEFQAKEKANQIKAIAVDKLSQYEIKVVDEVIKLVLGDDKDTTIAKIDVLNKLLTDERNKYIGQGAPTTSGGLGTSKAKPTAKSILDEGRII